MKVIYNDPDGRKVTYHPELGYLVSGRPFELEDTVAKGYMESGLLKKVKSERATLNSSLLTLNSRREGKDGHTDHRA